MLQSPINPSSKVRVSVSPVFELKFNYMVIHRRRIILSSACFTFLEEHIVQSAKQKQKYSH